MKTNRLQINSFLSVLAQAVNIVCGFVLPRAILSAYGSEVNGLVMSITQFLGIIGLLDLGVGAVIQAAYFRPLAAEDNKTVGLIFFDSKKFFRRIGYVLAGYVVAVVFIIRGTASAGFSFYFVSSLVLCIALSFFAQYFFTAPYSLLLNADQKFYLTAGLQIVLSILNVAVSLILIRVGASITLVKLCSSLVFLAQPLVLIVYVWKNYPLIKPEKGETYRLEQKWNGVAQHVATVIMNNADVVVLTVFADLIVVSVYSVTCIVINGIKSLVSSLSSSFTSFFGDRYARGDLEGLRRHFDFFEWAIHALSTLLCSLTGVLILGFVANYTRNVNDADYVQPLFAILMTCGLFVYCIRIPYNAIVCGAGHFRQTQMSAVIEAASNVVISIALVFAFGLVGVAVGTLVAIVYRTAYFVFYLKRNIIRREFFPFLKNLLIDLLECAATVAAGTYFISLLHPAESFLNWFFTALATGGVSLAAVLILNAIFYRPYLLRILRPRKQKGE
ncbi:MAG: polysaccharide biosynthesis C-terminal domain-containing protein [Clostridia bacterium]|nr:polysaccharide biosynthesis C-terminal domain-containing protein [Clostridia bacterium]